MKSQIKTNKKENFVKKQAKRRGITPRLFCSVVFGLFRGEVV